MISKTALKRSPSSKTIDKPRAPASQSADRFSVPSFRGVPPGSIRHVVGDITRSLAEQAADAILHAIATGILLPGDSLIEAEIARDLGFSRVPIREAIGRLESFGLIDGGSLWKSARLFEPTQKDIDELIELRRSMEVMALRHALRNQGGAAYWKDLRAALREGRAAAKSKDQDKMVAADRLFHRTLWDASKNSLLRSSLDLLAKRQMVMWSAVRDSICFPRAQTEHEAVMAAIDQGDGAEAERLLAFHIRWHRHENIAEAIARARERRAAQLS